MKYYDGKCTFCGAPENAEHRDNCIYSRQTANDGDLLVKEMQQDPIGSILLEMYEVNKAKRADYTGDRGIFANFIEAGNHIGVDAGRGIEYMIQTKQSRIKSLIRPGVKPNNESLDDSLLDRAVYSVLAIAAYRQGVFDV